jgi:hypothetical protein
VLLGIRPLEGIDMKTSMTLKAQKFRNLYNDAMKPGKIQKTGVHSEAFRIMKRWGDDPADGLR